MFKEFKEFAMRGNVMDMAVGIVIGAAFGTIVTSLVKDVIMPPIGLLLGNVDFSNIFAILKEGKTVGPYASVAAAKAAGAVTINVGVFINTIINFLIVAFAIFLVIRSIRGKSLADIHGKPMMWHVYQQALKSELLEDVYIATDDDRIAEVEK